MGDFFSNLANSIGQISFDAVSFQDIMSSIVPIASWVLRIIMIILGIVIFIRCTISLFREKNNKEVWGTLSFPNGARYELNHWENAIGRSNSCDVVLDFPFISRTHAAIMRDDKGNWTLFPLQTKNGTTHNGELIEGSTPLKSADVIGLGGVDLHFYPISEAEERDQARRQGVFKRVLSPNKTLGFLTFFQILMLIQSMITVEAEDVPSVLTSFGLLSLAMWALYIVYRSFQRTAFEVETLAFFLCTLSFGITAAYSPAALLPQTIAIFLGLGLFFALSLALRDLKLAVSLRWPVAGFAVVLLTFNLLLGQKLFGAKNWMQIGPVSFQPSEIIKIAFILAGAATLDRLFANRNLIFTTLFAGFCVGCLALMSDFGTALIFFIAFLVITFLRSGNLGFLAMMGVGAGLGVGIVLQFKPYIANRFEAWGKVWEFASTTGFQQTRTLSAIASGGWFGKSPDDVFLKKIFAANTDLVFGVVSEEFGLLLAILAVASIVSLTLFSIKSAAASRSSFYTIASCTAASMLAFQTCLNVFGSVDILPLTGVTFPFLSIGGSSIISCWGLLAFIKAADTRKNASFTVRRPKLRNWSRPTWHEEETPVASWGPEDMPPDDFWDDNIQPEPWDSSSSPDSWENDFEPLWKDEDWEDRR